MPAIFGSGSSATKTTSIDTPASAASASLKSLTKKLSAPQLSQYSSSSSSTKHSTSPSSSLTPTSISRRFKPKGNGPNSNHNAHNQDSRADDPARASIFRRLSPGLAARVKLLNGSADTSIPQVGRTTSDVGRIPENHLKELESLHQNLSIKVEKRGRAWSGLQLKRERSAPSLLNSPTKKHHPASPVGPPAQTATPVKPFPRPSHPGSKATATIIRELASTVPSDNSTGVPETDGAAASKMAAVGKAMAPVQSGSGSNGVESMQESTDLEEYLKRSTLADADQPPQPPPKDTPPAPSTPSSANAQSYFNPIGLHRAESIYSFSRASFSNQLSQLTSINLPQPAFLESSISSIVNAPIAVRALVGAADQIQKWIKKAADVLNGLDAEDDVEWAAAGGREGLEEVDKAVTTFESLVNVYVKAIEEVQLRDDIGDVSADDLTLIVSQMETTLKNWAEIRNLLTGVKKQVELAMEWEELWNVVLGDVGLEVDNLSRLIFEMEENRHKSLAAESEAEQSSGLDINELETIVEESPFNGTPSSTKRFSLAVFPGAEASNAAGGSNAQDDANLMQLFARMQPLRASLDFLPMRLSMFQSRAEKLFPTSCEELEDRRKRLEQTYKKLEGDAEALRRELGEDRWILVFRNAGKQAQKMCESVERSIGKLQESLEAGDPVNNPTAITKKMESYEAKKTHYVPAIGRVMSIIQKGVHDRLTVNGEILALLSDITLRVDALTASMKVMDSILEETTIHRSQQLRDSISSIITMDSPATNSAIGTPGSSPASSIILTGPGGLLTPNAGGSSRRGSSVGSTARSSSNVRRLSSIPSSTGTNLGNRKSSIPRALNSPTSSQTTMSLTPTPAPRFRRASATLGPNKPRWNSSSNTNDIDTGHNFTPLTVTTPSPYKKSLPVPRTSRSISSSIPMPSPLSRATSSSPVPGGMRTHSRTASRLGDRPGSRLAAVSPSPASRIRSPMPMGSVLDPPPYSKLRKQASFTAMPGAARSRQSYAGPASAMADQEAAASSTKANRPGTALGHSNRRISLLPQLKKSGRESSTGSRNSKIDERPPWR